MTWTRTDDTAPHHPKLLRAGAEACWLWQAGLCYSNSQKLNGRLPKDLLHMLYPPLNKKLTALSRKLCDVRLWHDRGDHFEIHDYEQYQDAAMKEAVEARRQYERDRKRSQRHGDVPDNVPDMSRTRPAGQLREGKGRIGQGRDSDPEARYSGSSDSAPDWMDPPGCQTPAPDCLDELEARRPLRAVRR